METLGPADPVGMEEPPDVIPSMRGPATYRIRVRGALAAEELARLGDFRIVPEEETVLEGRVADQAALSGLLNALYHNHLPVISVECLGEDATGKDD